MIPPLTENCPGVSTIEVFSYPSVVSFRENVSSFKVSPTLIVNIFSTICEMDGILSINPSIVVTTVQGRPSAIFLKISSRSCTVLLL